MVAVGQYDQTEFVNTGERTIMSETLMPPVRQIVGAAPRAQDCESGSAGPAFRKLQILVVEDEPIIAELLSDVLEGMGHDVCAIAMSQTDAISAAERCRPDLMIVDVRLGRGSGLCAVDEILRERYVAHVFVSADLAAVRTQRPMSVAIQKPYRESELERAIQRSLVQPATT